MRSRVRIPAVMIFFFLMLWSTQQTFDVSTTSEWRLTLTLDWRWNQVENESFLDVGFWLDWSRPKINLIPTSLQRRIGRDQKSTCFQRLYNVVCLLGSDGTYDSMVMSVQVSIRPTLRPSGSPSARFSHLSPTCFDILSWNFSHDFVLMYCGSSSSVVTLRQFLKELCLFVNSEYRKCAVFSHFSPLCFDILSWNFAFDICFNVL